MTLSQPSVHIRAPPSSQCSLGTSNLGRYAELRRCRVGMSQKRYLDGHSLTEGPVHERLRRGLQEVPTNGVRRDLAPPKRTDQCHPLCFFLKRPVYGMLGRLMLLGCETTRATYFGGVSRWREHLICLVVPRSAQSDRPRYKEWRATSLTALRMVPTFGGGTSDIFKLENLCVASLQAPSHQGVGPAQAPRTYRPRKLPRFRKKPPIEEELNLNLVDELRRSPASRRKFDSQCSSFGSLCTFAMDHFKLLRAQVLLHMYSYRYVYWLALYLAGTRARLSYRKVWRIPNPVEFCARPCGACQKLPKHTKHVAVSKVLRFLRSGQLLPRRVHTIGVPAATARHYSATKQDVRAFLGVVRKWSSPATARLVGSFIRIR